MASQEYPNQSPLSTGEATLQLVSFAKLTSLCTTLKNRGITIAVLYIPYQPIQKPTTFANNEDVNANANIPPNQRLPASLQTCASPNFYYTATTPADIETQLKTMFDQAVSTAHITN